MWFFCPLNQAIGGQVFSYPDNLPADIKIYGDLRQGGILYGKTKPENKIKFNDDFIKVSKEGLFVIGFERDADVENKLFLVLNNNKEQHINLKLGERSWLIQKIDGLPEKMVSPDEATLQRIIADNSKVRQAREIISPNLYYNKGFIKPVAGQVSSPFGAQRILNGEKKTPHSGIDIAANTGTPVKVVADGVVSLVDDMYLTGNTVMVDHGLGLATIYVHLDGIITQLGKEVKQGDVIGTVGQTGRATGPHLHFGVSVGATRIDPESFLNIGLPDFF